MKRSLIAFQALLASSAVLCQTAEASSTYTAPEQLTGPAKANSIEARIEAVRNTDWGSRSKLWSRVCHYVTDPERRRLCINQDFDGRGAEQPGDAFPDAPAIDLGNS